MTDLLTRATALPAIVDDLDVLDPPASVFAGTAACNLVVAAAPSTGRFRPADTGERTEPGQVLGHVTGGKGRADAVVAPVHGALARLLVRPGQLVFAGQSLAWIRSDEAEIALEVA